MDFFEKEFNSIGNWCDVIPIYEGYTDYQLVQILSNKVYGKMLVLDGMLQSSTNYEFIFNEMLVHGAMCMHNYPRSILIIGGGSCDSARRVLQYTSVKELIVCDIDEQVYELCNTYIPEFTYSISQAIKQNTMSMVFNDAIAFLQKTNKKFDVIIIDGTDPIGEGKRLYTEDSFELCSRHLNENGIIATHSGNPLLYPKKFRDVLIALSSVCKFVRPAYCVEPEFPFAMYSFLYGSESGRIYWHNIEGKYFNYDLFLGSQMLPTFMRNIFLKEGMTNVAVQGSCYTYN